MSGVCVGYYIPLCGQRNQVKWKGMIYLICNNALEKLLDFDWLRVVQFKCNTRAKSVTLMQSCNMSANYIEEDF